MYGQDFTRIGIDCDGLDVNRIKSARTTPCLYPIWDVFIDWDGDVVPCCNLRSDNPAEELCHWFTNRPTRQHFCSLFVPQGGALEVNNV